MSKFNDNRGTLFFPIKENKFNFLQCTVSINKLNVFRGIHINSFDKLVTCVKGKILDIIINMNETSEDYLIPKYYQLDPNTDLFELFVPAGYGHSFLSLEDDSILIYHFNGIFTNENTKHIHYMDPYIDIKLPIEDPILSLKDQTRNFVKPIDYLIFGSKGFIGSCIVDELNSLNKNYICSNLRLQNTEEIIKILDLYTPKYIINCAGITGTPNIMWCEDHKEETVDVNITCQIKMADLCLERGIHLTVLGSGAIFRNDRYYSETDVGNFAPNFYSQCRIELEEKIKLYPNVLYLRINYPISSKKSSKNLLTKLLSYKIIDNISMSITCLDVLIPVLFQMIENNEIGICNFVCNGEINLCEIMNLYGRKNYECFECENNLKSCSKLINGILIKYKDLDIINSLVMILTKYH